MRCPNCTANSWTSVDKYRLKPQGMSICDSCGFVSYPFKWKSKEEIVSHYRKSYRKPPNHNNVYAGERKNHFHHKFLYETIQKWKNENATPKICEVGAAFGFALNWFRTVLPSVELYGTELTTSFKRVAKHEFNIDLKDDIDETIKYDMIMSYKVLEHQLDPDIELSRYHKCLSDDGLLYISVPTWFDTMENFGLNGFDIEYYYDPNHINVWTREIFESMLGKAGFKIIKSDFIMYGDTYLCKKSNTTGITHSENCSAIIDKMAKIQEASKLYASGDHEGAINTYKNYPTAWISFIEFNRSKLAELGWEKFKETFIDKFIKSCPRSPEALITATDYSMRAGELKDAIAYCEAALKAKPENPISLNAMVNIMREMHIKALTEEESLYYLKQAREVARHLISVSNQHSREAIDMIFYYDSLIPCEIK